MTVAISTSQTIETLQASNTSVISQDGDSELYFYYTTDNISINNGGTLSVDDSVLGFSSAASAALITINSGGQLDIGSSFSAGSETIYKSLRALVKMPYKGNHFQDTAAGILANSGSIVNLYGARFFARAPIVVKSGSDFDIQGCEIEAELLPNGNEPQLRISSSSFSINGLTLIKMPLVYLANFSVANLEIINCNTSVGAIAISTAAPSGTFVIEGYKGRNNSVDINVATSNAFSAPNIAKIVSPQQPQDEISVTYQSGNLGDINSSGIIEFWRKINQSTADSSIATRYLRDTDNSNRNSTSRGGLGNYLADRTYTDASSSGTFPERELLGGVYSKPNTTPAAIPTFDVRFPVTGGITGYGYFDFSLSLSDADVTETLTRTLNPFVDTATYPRATAAAITGVTFSAGTITVSESKTWPEFAHKLEHEVTLVDYSYRWDTARYWSFSTNTSGLVDADLVFSGTADIDGSGTIDMAANSTVTLGSKSSYSVSLTVPATGTINIIAGTYDLTAFTFASGSTLNLDSGTATVTVASDPGIVTTGAGTINIVSPTVAVTISPLVSGSRLKIYDTGTTTLVDGVNSSGTSFSFSTGTASQGYDIYIVNPGRKSVFINNYIYPSSSATLPVEQTADINYSATAGAYDITLDGSGIGVSADLWLDTANVEIQLATGNNLSQPTGISLQNLYSFIIESRYANDELMPYHDPVVAISATAGEFELRRGWHLKDNTTREPAS